MQWYCVLKLTFRKAVDQDIVTEPSLVLNMSPKTGFVGSNSEHDLNEAMQDITDQMDSFDCSGSG